MASGESATGEKGIIIIPESTLVKGATKATVRPSKGAIVSSFTVDSKKVFFPYQIVPRHSGLTTRGGNPVLFPNAGPLKKNTEFPTLGRHGFARNRAWSVKGIDNKSDSIVLVLASDNKTRLLYPYDFSAELSISVDEGKLLEKLSVTNLSVTAMPLAPAFQLYFNVPIDRRREVALNVSGFDPAKFNWNSSKH